MIIHMDKFGYRNLEHGLCRGGGGVKGTSGNYTPDCFTFSNRKSLGDFPDAFSSRLRFTELHCLCNKGAHRNAIFNMYVQC